MHVYAVTAFITMSTKIKFAEFFLFKRIWRSMGISTISTLKINK